MALGLGHGERPGRAQHCAKLQPAHRESQRRLWPWSTNNSLFQLNVAALTRTTQDGEGFDSDYKSQNTLPQYNYSHDNEGGFMLICTPGRRNAQDNIGNTGMIVRRNISRNDLTRVFHSGGNQSTIEDNAIYVGPGLDVQMLVLSDWLANGAIFRNNRFYVQGRARYGPRNQSQ